MKLAIVTACPNGKISSVLSARLLDAAAQRQGWSTSVEIHDPRHPEKQLSPGDIEAADWVLVVNTGALDLARFSGKRLYQATPAQALQDADGFLRSAAALATEHTATAVAATAPSSAQPRLVAVTACPTGVAHTFMAAEAIQQAAKKLGYDLQVETQGSVGARNPLSAQAIADADVVRQAHLSLRHRCRAQAS
jgi:PTS system fructose-specific IIC component